VYGGLICPDCADVRKAVLDQLFGLLRGGRIQMLSVNHLPTQHPLASALTERALIPPRVEPHWVATLVPGSIERTMMHHSAKHRKKLRRYDRVLHDAFDGDVQLRLFAQLEELDEFLELTTRLAASTYQHRLGVAVVDSPLWRSILSVEARCGRMRSYILLGSGRPIAYQNGVIYGHTYFCDGRGYDAQYRDLRPGNALSQQVMADLCETDCVRIDYGFGDAVYKQVYGTNSWNEFTLQLYARGWYPQTVATLQRCSDRVSIAATSLLSRAGWLEPLKQRWRRRLARRR
jgi:CelD/BcsL family acetyltransferase involved in cellulose biosynthesis